jgi:hypothetical protein
VNIVFCLLQTVMKALEPVTPSYCQFETLASLFQRDSSSALPFVSLQLIP